MCQTYGLQPKKRPPQVSRAAHYIALQSYKIAEKIIDNYRFLIKIHTYSYINILI